MLKLFLIIDVIRCSRVLTVSHQILTVEAKNDIEVLFVKVQIEVNDFTSCRQVLLVFQERQESHVCKLISLNIVIDHTISVVSSNKQVHL